MKIYVTRYALTRGITEHEAEVDGDSARVKTELMVCSCWFHGEGREWHRTIETAIAKAEAMRLKKIEHLKRQIARLEKMDFKHHTP